MKILILVILYLGNAFHALKLLLSGIGRNHKFHLVIIRRNFVWKNLGDGKCSSEGKCSWKTGGQGRSESEGPHSFWIGPCRHVLAWVCGLEDTTK